jgi:hypothetical protein
MSVPSVKGAAVQPVVKRMQKLVDQGKLSVSELEFRLGQDELDLLEQEIEPTLWYPIRSHDRLLEVKRDLLGAGEDRYLVELARRTAESLLSSGPYATMLESARSFGDRAGVPLIQMSKLIYNFTSWEYEGESLEDFTVHVSDARDFPETSRFSAEGFMGFVAEAMLGRPPRLRRAAQRRAPEPA